MILLIGSSIMKNWLPVLKKSNLLIKNNAICASTTADQLLHFHTLIVPYNPSCIIWYCGSNDINKNYTIYHIIFNILKWKKKVHIFFPHCHILLLSIIKSPQKYNDNHIHKINFINDFFLSFRTKNLTFVDLNQHLHDTNNVPIVRYYKKDNIHLTTSAYKLLSSLLLPIINI